MLIRRLLLLLAILCVWPLFLRESVSSVIDSRAIRCSYSRARTSPRACRASRRKWMSIGTGMGQLSSHPRWLIPSSLGRHRSEKVAVRTLSCRHWDQSLRPARKISRLNELIRYGRRSSNLRPHNLLLRQSKPLQAGHRVNYMARDLIRALLNWAIRLIFHLCL